VVLSPNNSIYQNLHMNWYIIILLSLFGAIMGILSVKGYTGKLEPILWLLFGIISALVLSRNVENRPFIHGLIIGLCWGVFNGIIQSSFFDQYITNNPSLQSSYNKSTAIKPQFLVLIMGPVIGLVTGAVLGGLTLLLKKIF